MKLSILIVSWNTRALLQACLESIYANPPVAPFEVLVVDNASQDGSQEMVRSRFPQVRLNASAENLGFAGGNNRAYMDSCGEYVLMLNPDTEVRPGALQTLVDFLDRYPQAGGVGARLLNADGSMQPSCSPEPTLRREFARLFHLPGVRPDGYYTMDGWALDQPRPVDVLLGACLLLRRTALDAQAVSPSNPTGLLDEDYFVYSEEVDLCYRLKGSGWLLYWEPRAQVVHYGGQSTRQVATEMFLNLYQGKVLYFRKNHNRPAVLAYKAILFAATLGRLLAAPLALFERDESRRQHLDLSGKYGRLLLALPGM